MKPLIKTHPLPDPISPWYVAYDIEAREMVLSRFEGTGPLAPRRVARLSGENALMDSHDARQRLVSDLSSNGHNYEPNELERARYKV